MILGQVEGYLEGLVIITLSRKIYEALYGITFEILKEDGTFHKTNPPFPVIQSEAYVEFRITEEWGEVYMRVTVDQTLPPRSTYVEKECNECALLNNTWKIQV